MDIHEICEALKDLGVQEVILEHGKTGGPTIEFAGRVNGEDFRIIANNVDFANNSL